MSDSSPAFRPSGSIEFEAVDPVVVARQHAAKEEAAVDDGIDRDPLSINFERGKLVRPSAAERMLSSTAIDWFVALAAADRPKALCERYPHVANRLAGAWPQRAQAHAAIAQLADDPRWGQAGFPAQVQGELQRLLALLASTAR